MTIRAITTDFTGEIGRIRLYFEDEESGRRTLAHVSSRAPNIDAELTNDLRLGWYLSLHVDPSRVSVVPLPDFSMDGTGRLLVREGV